MIALSEVVELVVAQAQRADELVTEMASQAEQRKVAEDEQSETIESLRAEVAELGKENATINRELDDNRAQLVDAVKVSQDQINTATASTSGVRGELDALKKEHGELGQRYQALMMTSRQAEVGWEREKADLLKQVEGASKAVTKKPAVRKASKKPVKKPTRAKRVVNGSGARMSADG